MSGAVLTKWEKTMKGSMCGTLGSQYDIVKLLRLYDAGKLKLDELITRHYRLEDINQGYADLRAGEIIRGVTLHDSWQHRLRYAGSSTSKETVDLMAAAEAIGDGLTC